MRLLLDECIPKRLGREFPGHRIRTVQQAGWGGLKNGRLLRAAEREFDVFITVDQSLHFQQNISGYDIALVLLEAPSNDIEDLRPLVSQVVALLPTLRPGEVVQVRREVDRGGVHE